VINTLSKLERQKFHQTDKNVWKASVTPFLIINKFSPKDQGGREGCLLLTTCIQHFAGSSHIKMAIYSHYILYDLHI
jgi:hypothetical protein